MRTLVNYVVKVFATGFIVLVLLSLPLFWARWLSEARIGMMISDECRQISIEPSGLVPPELENDSKVAYHSEVSASLGSEGVILGPGIVHYFMARAPEFGSSNVYYYRKDNEDWLYFDERLGQIVCRYTAEQRMPDKTVLPKKVRLYAGPEGISESPDKALGRFIDPIVDVRARPPHLLMTLYDMRLRRFFTINFEKKTVVKGPELGKGDLHRPVQIGWLQKNPVCLSVSWLPPRIKLSREDTRESPYARTDLVDLAAAEFFSKTAQYVLALDRSGRIDLLDRETLEFARPAGYLPPAETLFPSKPDVTPEDLLAYDVMALASKTDGKYRGMFVASLCREGTASTLAVFDENGRLLRTQYSRLTRRLAPGTVDAPSSRAALFHVPRAPVLTIGKWLAENLHPPILSLVSYFTAYSFEAAAGHRALFILPNSFIAMKGRDVRQNAVSRLGYALLLMLPSLILGIFLAWRVEKDATMVGLSDNARLFWMIGAIAFGLAGYITYRLTRPKETLVTCGNCGKLRRPDMERCHRCGSKWQFPELTPPSWRVTDSV